MQPTTRLLSRLGVFAVAPYQFGAGEANLSSVERGAARSRFDHFAGQVPPILWGFLFGDHSSAPLYPPRGSGTQIGTGRAITRRDRRGARPGLSLGTGMQSPGGY